MATKIVGSKPRRPARATREKPGSHHTSREPKVARRGAPATQSWATFTNALAGVLRVLRDDQFLILQHMRSRYFVQFAADGRTGLRAEAVSNTYLSRKKKLDDTKMAKLQRMGWNSPGPKRNQSPNFYRDWNKATESSAAADLAVVTLRRIFGVARPSELEYWAFAVKGGEILLPTLRINQERRTAKKQKPKGEPLATSISSREELLAEISTSLKSILKTKDIVADNDGDFPVGTKHGTVYVRVSEKNPSVRLFSLLVRDVRPEPALLDALNRLNTEYRYLTFEHDRGFVVIRFDLWCSPFVPAHFSGALDTFCSVVDEVANDLRSRFGGDENVAGADPLWAANLSAERATVAWLKGEGLARASDIMRLRDASSPIPAPVIDQWHQKLVEATTNSVRAADAVLEHINKEARFTPKQLAAQVARAAEEANAAERCCRTLAQLTLGITSHTEWCDETARLERAATLVLARSGVQLEDEETVFLGRDRSELVTEVAGLICRMLTQQRCGKMIGDAQAGRPAIELVVDDKSNLLVRHGGEERRWDAPVTVIEPAGYVADFLSEHGGMPPDA